MKILLDQNLSPRLISKLADSFQNLIHVRDYGLDMASDLEVWEFAKNNLAAIVTKDSDLVIKFQYMAFHLK